MSQRDEILELLEAAGPDGVCGTTFLSLRYPRYAARVYELRDLGALVRRVRCTDEWHRHRSAQWRYVLDRGPLALDDEEALQ